MRRSNLSKLYAKQLETSSQIWKLMLFAQGSYTERVKVFWSITSCRPVFKIHKDCLSLVRVVTGYLQCMWLIWWLTFKKLLKKDQSCLICWLSTTTPSQLSEKLSRSFPEGSERAKLNQLWAIRMLLSTVSSLWTWGCGRAWSLPRFRNRMRPLRQKKALSLSVSSSLGVPNRAFRRRSSS
jgi:hypothetical protein